MTLTNVVRLNYYVTDAAAVFSAVRARRGSVGQGGMQGAWDIAGAVSCFTRMWWWSCGTQRLLEAFFGASAEGIPSIAGRLGKRFFLAARRLRASHLIRQAEETPPALSSSCSSSSISSEYPQWPGFGNVVGVRRCTVLWLTGAPASAPAPPHLAEVGEGAANTSCGSPFSPVPLTHLLESVVDEVKLEVVLVDAGGVQARKTSSC